MTTAQRNIGQRNAHLFECHVQAAAYNSYKSPKKRSAFCDGTRIDYIGKIMAWVAGLDQQRPHRLLWVQGVAGTGKTALACECARRVDKNGVPVASFFFSRESEVTEASQFFTTIAFQIATQIAEYKEILEAKVNENPDLLKTELQDQFQDLIIEPLLDLDAMSLPAVVFVDGLEQCRDPSAQIEIIRLVAKSIREYRNRVPLLWAFFTRPESRIVHRFSHELVSPLCEKHELRVSRELDDEIKLFLQDAVGYNPSAYNWLTDEDLDKLVDISDGLFICAATLIDFILSEDAHGPKDQLNRILLFCSSRKKGLPVSADNDPNPFAALDIFYRTIMGDILERFPVVFSDIQKVLLLHHALPRMPDSLGGDIRWIDQQLSPHPIRPLPSTRLLANLAALGLQQKVSVLSKLSSILVIKQEDGQGSIEWGSATISFHHPSFMEFLADQKRSGKLDDQARSEGEKKLFEIDLWIERQDHWNTLTMRCADLLIKLLATNSIPRDEIVQKLKRIFSAYPEKYAISQFLEFRNELYNHLHRNLFLWCGRLAEQMDDKLIKKLDQIDFRKMGRLGVLVVPPEFLDKLPLTLRNKIKKGADAVCGLTPSQDCKLAELSKPPTKFQKVWNYVCKALGLIMLENRILIPGEDLKLRKIIKKFRTAANAEGPSEVFYSRLNDDLSGILQMIFKQRMKKEFESLDGFDLLQFYLNEWRWYEGVAKQLQDIFGPRGQNVDGMLHETRTLVLLPWKSTVLKSAQGNDFRLTRAAIGLLTEQRNGHMINRRLLEAFIASLLALCCIDLASGIQQLDVYQENFEERFLADTTSYYTAEAASFPIMTALLPYLEHAEDRLREEERNIAPYLPDGRRRKLITACERILIGDHLGSMSAEFKQLLTRDKGKDDHLRRIYSLTSRISSETHTLLPIFESHVKEAVHVAVSSIMIDSDENLLIVKEDHISILLNIQQLNSERVEQLFQMDIAFSSCVTRIFDDLFAENSRLAELVHSYAAKYRASPVSSTSEERIISNIIRYNHASGENNAPRSSTSSDNNMSPPIDQRSNLSCPENAQTQTPQCGEKLGRNRKRGGDSSEQGRRRKKTMTLEPMLAQALEEEIELEVIERVPSEQSLKTFHAIIRRGLAEVSSTFDLEIPFKDPVSEVVLTRCFSVKQNVALTAFNSPPEKMLSGTYVDETDFAGRRNFYGVIGGGKFFLTIGPNVRITGDIIGGPLEGISFSGFSTWICS